jgi:hypothetical protein
MTQNENNISISIEETTSSNIDVNQVYQAKILQPKKKNDYANMIEEMSRYINKTTVQPIPDINTFIYDNYLISNLDSLEGPFFNLTNHEIDSAKYSEAYTKEEDLAINNVRHIYKITHYKNRIFTCLIDYAKHRCKTAWDLYSEAYINFVEMYWNSLNENDEIVTRQFYVALFT